MLFLLNFGKWFPNSLCLLPIWKTRCRLLPSEHLEMAFVVQKARCRLETVTLPILCCPFTSD